MYGNCLGLRASRVGTAYSYGWANGHPEPDLDACTNYRGCAYTRAKLDTN